MTELGEDSTPCIGGAFGEDKIAFADRARGEPHRPGERITAPWPAANAAAPARKPLRIGLLVDSLQVPAWVARIVSEVQSGDYAEIAAVIVNRASENDDAPFWKRVLARIIAVNGLLFGVFRMLDRLAFRASNNPFRRIDIAAEALAAETFTIAPQTSGTAGWPGDADLARIRRLELDALLCFGSRDRLGEGILDVARYGVWSYRHGQAQAHREAYGLFYDMYDRSSVSSVALQIDGPRPLGGRVIYRSVGNVIPWSYSRNVYYHYWKSTSFVPRRLKLLAEEGFPAIERLSEESECPTQGCGRSPTNREMLRFLPRHAALLAQTASRRCFRDERWFLVVNTGPRLANPACPATAKMKIHRAPPGRFWADPFPVVVDGQVWVFFEDYRFTSKKGIISCAPVSADGILGDVSTALECSYHFSYPFILEYEGDLYMAPDTWPVNRVELWRCRKFPDDWVRERVLMDGLRMSDPTIHQQDGKLWLFGTVSEGKGWANDELHIYMADALDGAWRPHPANPVVSDCRRARPAGQLFFRDGCLIRPAQDCSGRYGSAIVLNRVDELNERSYAETPVGRIDGSWLAGNRGSVHTVNYAGSLEFLDGRAMTPRRKYPFLRGSHFALPTIPRRSVR